VGQYRAKNTELLVRDASCAAVTRLQNQQQQSFPTDAASANQKQSIMLAQQALQALPGSGMTPDESNAVTQWLTSAISSLQESPSNLPGAITALQSACQASQ
jgi:hypothetical protein